MTADCNNTTQHQITTTQQQIATTKHLLQQTATTPHDSLTIAGRHGRSVPHPGRVAREYEVPSRRVPEATVTRVGDGGPVPRVGCDDLRGVAHRGRRAAVLL